MNIIRRKKRNNMSAEPGFWEVVKFFFGIYIVYLVIEYFLPFQVLESKRFLDSVVSILSPYLWPSIVLIIGVIAFYKWIFRFLTHIY